jgi:hypothetical protein
LPVALGRGAGQQREDETAGGRPAPGGSLLEENQPRSLARLARSAAKPAAFETLRAAHQKSLLPLRVS